MFDADMWRLNIVSTLQRGHIDSCGNELSRCETQNLSHGVFYCNKYILKPQCSTIILCSP